MTHWPEKITFIVLLMIAILAGAYLFRTCGHNPVYAPGGFPL